jgi:hypothetical protein
VSAIVSSRLLRSILGMLLDPDVADGHYWACFCLSLALASPLARAAAVGLVPDLVPRLEAVVASGDVDARPSATTAIELMRCVHACYVSRDAR